MFDIKIFITLLLSLGLNVLAAQKQDYIWHLGGDITAEFDINAMQVDFGNSTMPANIEVMELPVGFDHNNQAICNENGELLFYTNGCAVMNRNHQIMPHGDTLNHSSFKESTGWANCKLGYPGVQNILILDDPANESGYYIIHKTWVKVENQVSSYKRELRNTYVDLDLDQGMGDVTYFDSIVTNDQILSSYLTAIKHVNQKDWWIIQPIIGTEEFATFLVDSNGINRMPNQNSNQYYSYWFSGSLGTSRFSPDGSKYVYYNRHDNIHLYDFDRESGVLDNHQFIELFPVKLDSTNYQYGSVEWSSDSRFMYITNRDSLHQIDTWEPDIDNDGIRLIDVYNGTLDPFTTTFRIMTLAPDCKIYICSGNGSYSYHVINEPNFLGAECNFVQNGINLPIAAGPANLPLHPRWRVDEDEKCDETITSVFGLDVYYRRDLDIYPNPVHQDLNITISEQQSGQVIIYDMEGKILIGPILVSNHSDIHQVDVSALSSGTYIVEYVSDDRKDRLVYNQKFVKI